MRINISILSLLFVLQAFYLQAQLTVDANITPEKLVEKLAGIGVEIKNVVIDCPDEAIGFFEAQNTNLGLQNGILMTTGNINNAIGPNNHYGTETRHNAQGDKDLEKIVNEVTKDACILSFDLIPSSDKLSFDYIFASEEYLEFTGEEFNDVFAFFVSGSNMEKMQNIALIPNTTEQVSINTINLEKNSEWFVYNGDGETNIDPNSTIQYDGFTKPLTATLSVTPYDTYHFKLTIADVADDRYDSGVFIQANSFESNPLEATYVPIDLLYFEAVAQDNGVYLEWEVATEWQNDFFQLERSKDGEDFEAIQQIQGRGNALRMKKYTYLDPTPLKGQYYYRLKQCDWDGKSQLMATQSIWIETTESLFIEDCYKQGNTLQVTISTSKDIELDLGLIDLLGIEHTHTTVSLQQGRQSLSLEVGDLPHGIYFLVGSGLLKGEVIVW